MNFLFVVISGILYFIPFFNPDLYFISWFAFLPFLFSIYKDKYNLLFLKSWLLGFLIYIGVGYPLYYPIKMFTDFPNLLVIIIIIILFAILSLIYGLLGKIYKIIQKKKGFNPYLFSLSWLGLEVIRHIILNFFPLGYLGYTQAHFTQIIQIADLGGVFIVSFIIVLFNALIFKFIISKNKKYIFTLIVIIALVISYGQYQKNRYTKTNEIINVGIFQSEIEQKEKWLPNNIEKYNELFINDNPKFANTSLIITPESALTFDMNKDLKYREKVLSKIEKINKFYQIGTLSTKDNKNQYYNSTYLINPAGEIENRYDKNKLVLFGEKVYFSDLLYKITGYRINSLLAGKEVKIFKTPFASWKTIICSEILHPKFVAKRIEEVDFVINQSNEAWFKNNKNLKNQMFASLIFRAVENRRSFIKAGNKTYSGIVYPNGNYVKFKNELNINIEVQLKQ